MPIHESFAEPIDYAREIENHADVLRNGLSYCRMHEDERTAALQEVQRIWDLARRLQLKIEEDTP